MLFKNLFWEIKQFCAIIAPCFLLNTLTTLRHTTDPLICCLSLINKPINRVIQNFTHTHTCISRLYTFTQLEL